MKVLSRWLPHTACDLVSLVFFLVVVVIFHAWESSGKNPNFGLKQESSESGDAQKASCNTRFNRKPELLHQVISSWICWFTLLLWCRWQRDASPRLQATTALISNRSGWLPRQRKTAPQHDDQCCPRGDEGGLKFLPLISWSSTRWKTFLQPNAERYRSFAKH